TDENRRLEILDGLHNPWALACKIEMIERFAGRQVVRVGQFVRCQTGTSGNHKTFGVEHSDLLPRKLRIDALLSHRSNDQVGQANSRRASAQKETSLLLEYAAGNLEPVDQSSEHHTCSPLNVVVVAAHAVAVTRKEPHGIDPGPVFAVQTAV